VALITFDIVDRPRPQLRYGTGGTLTLKLYSDGTLNVPSLATVTVKRPGGAACTTPVSGAAVSIDGTGIMTYTLSAGNADLLPAYGDAYSPWSADWVVTSSGGTVYYKTTFFDVVKNPFFGIVTQADLVNHHKDLTDSLFTGESTAQTYINMAQEDIQRRFENGGYRFWLILDAEQVRRPIEHLALAKYFASRVSGAPDDRWSALRDYHQHEADSWWENSRYIYDVNQTSDVTPDEIGRAAGQSFFRV
jgi:hypothetical protein